MSIRAKVASGRIIVDQPTLLPEGTTMNLVVDDEGDELNVVDPWPTDTRGYAP